MKYTILLLGLIGFTLNATSQTKLINHKRHSGNSATFSKAISKGFIGNSNFGQAPQRLVRNSRLDSVILLTPTTAVMVTSESCHYEDFNGNDRGRENLWSAGRDTVENHELFNAERSLSEIKQALKDDYFFTNKPESIVFVGFDGNYAKQEEKKPIRKNINPKLKSEEEEIDQDLIWLTRKKTWLDVLIISLFGTLFPGRF